MWLKKKFKTNIQISSVSLFNGISVMFVEKLYWYYIINSCWRDKGVCTFANVISPKVSDITRLDFELTYYGVTVKHV